MYLEELEQRQPVNIMHIYDIWSDLMLRNHQKRSNFEKSLISLIWVCTAATTYYAQTAETCWDAVYRVAYAYIHYYVTCLERSADLASWVSEKKNTIGDGGSTAL